MAIKSVAYPRVPDSGVPATPIGPGKPLSLRLRSIYPGDEDHGQLLLSSAVRNSSLFNAAPRALHYAFDRAPGMAPLVPSTAQPGSRVVYYSPAILDDALDVEVRYAYDDFDLEKYTAWLNTASQVLELPVFAVATTIGGAAGPGAGQAIMYFVKSAVRLVLSALDRRKDSDNDWFASWTINVSQAGLERARAGWVLFYGDKAEAEVMAPDDDGSWTDQHLLTRDKAYAVDVSNGTLVYADNRTTIVTGEPYALAFLDGAEEPALEGWKATAVSAALTQKFFDVTGDTITDLGALFEAYNDTTMAVRISDVDKALAAPNLSPEQSAALAEKRTALLKNVQNADFRSTLG